MAWKQFNSSHPMSDPQFEETVDINIKHALSDYRQNPKKIHAEILVRDFRILLQRLTEVAFYDDENPNATSGIRWEYHPGIDHAVNRLRAELQKAEQEYKELPWYKKMFW